MEKTEHELLKEANDLLRSFHSVCDRKGVSTNWDPLLLNLKRVLKEQHQYLYPTVKQLRLKKLNKINEQNSE